MKSKDPKVGLFFKQQHSEQANSQLQYDPFEFQEFVDDQQQIVFGDDKTQNNAFVLANLDQEPITMLKRSQSTNLRPIQTQQMTNLIQIQPSPPVQQQFQQIQMSTINQQTNKNQNQTLSELQLEQTNSNQISQSHNQDLKTINQIQSTCIFCKIPQMIPNNKSAFICYSCNQINKIISSYFICGTCKMTVIYQQGISNLINCTNCLTTNYVQQANLPQSFSQSDFLTIQIQYQVSQNQIISNESSQQQIPKPEEQQQRNQISELESEFKDLIN